MDASGHATALAEPGAARAQGAPNLPEFADRCITNVVPSLFKKRTVSFLPDEVLAADRVVLLVADGLGWRQLVSHFTVLPHLSALEATPICSVLPSTTATALTSITTGTTPSTHGVVGYRIVEHGEVLNVLKWSTPTGDARGTIPPQALQRIDPFFGAKPPIVSRAEFAGTGFSLAHLSDAPLCGWRVPSSIVVEVRRLLRSDAPFVYAYYDGVDKVAHDKGLGEYFVEELVALDRLVGDLCAALPRGCALCVTADHGQVEVRDAPITLDEAVVRNVVRLSGEGRFRWLHAREGATEDVRAECEARYGDVAWVRTKAALVEENWFGGPLSAQVQARLGDVALVAKAPIAFFDPDDTGELRLVARHGSATDDEMLVPFLCYVA